MEPAVLFWFYKKYGVCAQRLKALREINPKAKIYGLYGGPVSEAQQAKASLGSHLEDLYVFPEERSAAWKWRNGDQLIARWYKERGKDLDWETVFIMQWDMLPLAALGKLFSTLLPNQILLSGFRPVAEVESWWPWAGEKNPVKRKEYDSFKEFLRSRFGYEGPIFACLFVVVCFPRSFLQRYSDESIPETGFLEYKIPTLARVFGTPICSDHPYEPWWAANPQTRLLPSRKKLLNGVGREVPTSVILRELSRPDGARLFHPVSRNIPRWILGKPGSWWTRGFSLLLDLHARALTVGAFLPKR